MTDRHTDENVLLLECCCETWHSWHHWNPPTSRLSEKIFCSPSTTLRSFGSPDHFGVFVLRNAYRSWFVGFFAKKWPVFQVKNLTLIKICDNYASITWMPKSKKKKIFFFFYISFSERRSQYSRLSDTLPTSTPKNISIHTKIITQTVNFPGNEHTHTHLYLITHCGSIHWF